MHDVILIQSANLVHVPAPAPKAAAGGKDCAAKAVAPQEVAAAAVEGQGHRRSIIYQVNPEDDRDTQNFVWCHP